MDLLQVFWSLLETQLQRSMLNEEKDLEKKKKTNFDHSVKPFEHQAALFAELEIAPAVAEAASQPGQPQLQPVVVAAKPPLLLELEAVVAAVVVVAAAVEQE
jgi:hypothetical protein